MEQKEIIEKGIDRNAKERKKMKNSKISLTSHKSQCSFLSNLLFHPFCYKKINQLVPLVLEQ